MIPKEIFTIFLLKKGIVKEISLGLLRKETPQAGQSFPSHLTTSVIDALHFPSTVGEMADRQFRLRPDYEHLARLFLLAHIGQLLVVHSWAVLHRLRKQGVFAQQPLDKCEHRYLIFHVAYRMSKHDDITGKAFLLKKSKRNGIGYASIKEFVPADFHQL